MSGIVKIGVVTLLVLVGVGFFVWRRGGAERMPNTTASNTHWQCDKCGRHVELTAQQVDQWLVDGQHINRQGGGRQQIRFKCDACGTFTLCHATLCPQHKVWFVPVNSKDEAQDCPQCAKKARG